MTFQELLVDAEVELKRMRIEGPRAEDASVVARSDRPSSRSVIAATMVRIGAWLDDEAAERFVIARRTQ